MSQSLFPCLEARILGGAFIHERWGDCSDSRLVALCESDWTATVLAKALAADERPETNRAWIITDARGGSQQVWDRARVDAEKAKEPK